MLCARPACDAPMPRLLPAALALCLVAALGFASVTTRPDVPHSPAPSFAFEEATIADLQARMRDGRLDSVTLTRAYLDRITAIDDAGPTLRAVIELNPRALDEARALDAERAAGRVRGALGLSALKLLVLPALVLPVASLGFGLEGVPLGVVVMLAALPTGSNALIFAQRYDTHQAEATAAIVVSTTAFALTSSLWIAVLALVGRA